MVEKTRRPLVAVIGNSAAEENVLASAEQVGRAIAGQGWNLLTGGGKGVMAAACFGFAQAKTDSAQVAVGILPSDDQDWANPYVDIAIPTGMGMARNAIIARTAAGLIAVGGSSGTLSEMALAWQFGKPLVALQGLGGWAGELAGRAIDDRRKDVVFAAAGAEQAVAILAKLFARS